MSRAGRLRTGVRYHARRQGDAAIRWVVWRLPRRVVMWAAYRVIANATTGPWRNQEVPALTAMDAIERWGVR